MNVHKNARLTPHSRADLVGRVERGQEPTRYVSWSKPALKTFMGKNPDLHSALKTTLAIDLAGWLKATWAHGAT